GGVLRVEREGWPGIAQPANAEALEERKYPGPRFTRERFVVEHCLPFAPSSVRPGEAAVVAVPDGKATSIEAIANAVGGEPGAITPVVIRTQISDRWHGQCVETKPVAARHHRPAKWLQHRVLALEIGLLRLAMADAEMTGVCSHAPD